MLRVTVLGSLALLGCPSRDEPAVHPAHASGRRALLDTFAIKDQVYLDAHLAPGRDVFFDVVDGETGALLSQDDLACRRIHVGARGSIDRVYAARDPDGDPCAHRAGHGTVQLMPFGDATSLATDALGRRSMHFTLRVFGAEGPARGDQRDFFVRLPML